MIRHFVSLQRLSREQLYGCHVKSAVYFNHSNGIFICFHHQFPVCLCLPELCGGTMDLRSQRGKNILLLKIMRAGECREDGDRYIYILKDDDEC